MTRPTWEQALDELEQHLHHCESLLSEGSDASGAPGGSDAVPVPGRWLKPDGLGPLPAHLVDRAFALRERQAAVIAALPGAIAVNRQQRAAADRPRPGGPARPGSVYLDVTA